MRAVKWLCLMGVVALLAGGCDKRKWPDRNDALRRKTAWGSVEQVQTLLARGANINARDKDGNTALHAAARQGRLAVAQLLIGRGANVNLQNNQGKTPVVLAMEGNTRLRLDMPDGTSVMDTRKGDRLALVELLAAVGAEPTFRLAAYLGDREMVRRLIAAAPTSMPAVPAARLHCIMRPRSAISGLFHYFWRAGRMSMPARTTGIRRCTVRLCAATGKWSNCSWPMAPTPV